MSLRRSLRIQAGKVPHRFEPASLSKVETDTEDRQQQELDEKPFRFLELPREMQDMVYSCYASHIANKYKRKKHDCFRPRGEPNRRQLANTPIPALAHVCQEIRADFLQILFEKGKFALCIGPSHSLLGDRWTSWNRAMLLNRTPKTKDPDDPIYLSEHMSGLLKPDMVVRNVLVSLHERNASAIESRRKKYVRRPPAVYYRSESSREILTLKLKWSGKQLTMQPTPTHSRPPGGDGVLARITAAVQEIGAREGFRGFTVEDLRRIARAMTS